MKKLGWELEIFGEREVEVRAGKVLIEGQVEGRGMG